MAAELLDDANQSSPGVIAPDGSAWSSAGSALATASHYRVNLQIDTPRGVKTHTSEFTTLTPTATISAQVSPGDDEKVGVGQPIIVRFSDPVSNKAAVEQHLVVTPSTPVVGSWHWFGDNEVHYRPQQYWPPNISVDVAANLAGVDFGDGVWGDQNITTHFGIGDANVSTADLQSHRMIVTKNGQQLADIPISGGKDGFPTMTGTLLVLNKASARDHGLLDERHPARLRERVPHRRAVGDPAHEQRHLRARSAVVGRLAGLGERVARLPERVRRVGQVVLRPEPARRRRDGHERSPPAVVERRRLPGLEHDAGTSGSPAAPSLPSRSASPADEPAAPVRVEPVRARCGRWHACAPPAGDRVVSTSG